MYKSSDLSLGHWLKIHNKSADYKHVFHIQEMHGQNN
jgi:hypothetical protein